MYALQESWKSRKDYIGDIRAKHPRIYNSWRSIMFTQKGKKAGISEEWKNFRTFYNDVVLSYQDGKVFRRLDATKPFSKDNFIWVTNEEAMLLKSNLITITYNNKTATSQSITVPFIFKNIRTVYRTDMSNIQKEKEVTAFSSEMQKYIFDHAGDPKGLVK